MFRGSNSVKRQQWAERLARYRRSEQTVSEFCGAERISVPSFYQWKRKLGDCRQGRPVTGPQRPKREVRWRGSGNFKPLRVIASPKTLATIRLVNGIVIDLGSDVRVIEVILGQVLTHGSSVGVRNRC